jgi:hypothetical protein
VLHAGDGLLAFDVTHDCMFPGNARLEIAVTLRQSERPARAEVESLLRALFDQIRAATAPAVPDLAHVCAFPAGTTDGQGAYGCVAFEGDEGPEGELAVHVEVPFAPAEWVASFAANHSQRFLGGLRPQVAADTASGAVVVTYPFLDRDGSAPAPRLTLADAAIDLFPWLFDFFPAKTDVPGITFVGAWRGRTVLTVRIANADDFLAMNPWPIRERMAAAGIPTDPAASRTAAQDAILGREYLAALRRLPRGSVVVDPSLGSLQTARRTYAGPPSRRTLPPG